MRTRSQYYAETTYTLVAEIQGLDRKDQKRYGALCHRFPLIVRECGLAAAFGFLAAKSGADRRSPENLLLGHYARVLKIRDTDALREAAVNTDLAEYCRLTRHALMVAEWLKRYAEGVLKVDATGFGEEEEDRDAWH